MRCPSCNLRGGTKLSNAHRAWWVVDPPEMLRLAIQKFINKPTITKMMRTRRLKMRRSGTRLRVLRMTHVSHRSKTSRGNNKNSASSKWRSKINNNSFWSSRRSLRTPDLRTCLNYQLVAPILHKKVNCHIRTRPWLDNSSWCFSINKTCSNNSRSKPCSNSSLSSRNRYLSRLPFVTLTPTRLLLTSWYLAQGAESYWWVPYPFNWDSWGSRLSAIELASIGYIHPTTWPLRRIRVAVSSSSMRKSGLSTRQPTILYPWIKITKRGATRFALESCERIRKETSMCCMIPERITPRCKSFLWRRSATSTEYSSTATSRVMSATFARWSWYFLPFRWCSCHHRHQSTTPYHWVKIHLGP